MAVFNTRDAWGWPAKALHWIIGIGMIGMLAYGIYIADFLDDWSKLNPTRIHKSIGMMLLALVALRIVWRALNRATPALPEDMPLWQKAGSHGAHLALYALMILMPLSGWAASSAAPLNIPTEVFIPGIDARFFAPKLISAETATAWAFSLGLVSAPDGLDAMQETWLLFKNMHALASNALIAVIVLHVLAALKHHFVNRDAILRRMLPFGR